MFALHAGHSGKRALALEQSSSVANQNGEQSTAMITVEPVPGLVPSPVRVAARLRRARLPGLVFLDTAGNHYHSAPLSILTACPDAVFQGNIHQPDDREQLRGALEAMRLAAPAGDLGIPLGGLFGGVAFDGRYCFGRYPRLLVFHHPGKRWLDIGGFLRHHPEARQTTDDNLQDAREPLSCLNLVPTSDRRWYENAVRQAQEYIAAGDIYQVNLARAFESKWDPGEDAFRFYQELRSHSPAPYSAFLDLEGVQVLSASPESFLKMSGDCIRTCPIKGTRPRFRDEEQDEKSAYDLLTSAKEVSELIMITDLERNDLGRVCAYGSVRVSELLKIERFEQVFHLVSTINGQLRRDVDHLDAFQACFPGGSITGAPKKRAVEIIAELEREPRGLYTGAVGYFGANGESQFNIAIRTALVEGSRVRFHVGAGIVADSDPGFEYEETLHKAAGILAAAGALRTSQAPGCRP